ncbi:MAG: M14-type cytosolic carboxypeptidase [Pseudomonadota bacterium]
MMSVSLASRTGTSAGRLLAAVLLVPLLLAGCLTHRSSMPPCAFGSLRVDAGFDGGAIAQCTRQGESALLLTIRPEAPPTNNSPWYAFRISSESPRRITVTLAVEEGRFRYWPKFSRDGENWFRMPDAQAETVADDTRFTFSTQVDRHPLWVSAQELVTTDDYAPWLDAWAAAPGATRQTIGTSRDGQPVELLTIGSGPETVVLLGRQHPPEVSGALAMTWFLDEVFGSSELATTFRERFRILAVPLINPDGVDRGHWRFGTGGLDLNRDWGGFTEPEPAAVRDVIDAWVAGGADIRLVLDFHSTYENKFYTQMPEDNAQPPGFATLWLDRSRERLPDFEFEHDPRPPSGQANTKNYFFERFGIHAITYELGDETDRRTIRQVTPVFAQEMMRTLLEWDRPAAP